MKIITYNKMNDRYYEINLREIPLGDLKKLLGLAKKVHADLIEVSTTHHPCLTEDGRTTTPYRMKNCTVVNNSGYFELYRFQDTDGIYSKVRVTSEKGDSYVIARHRMDNTYYILREYDYVPYVVRYIPAEEFPSDWRRIRKAGYLQESCNWSDTMIEGAIVDYHNGINRKRDVNEHLHEQLPGLFR